MQLFDLISLLYVILGARAVWTLSKNWRAFTDDELTAFDRRLASEIAFFVFIPIGVFLHELGHAAATYEVGGTINWFGGGFHYALFYGYVIPEGRFTPLQDWWIALAGNLVSVVYGFVPLILLRVTDKAWLKYMVLAFARIQLGWSLVGYPLLTFAGFEGDWTTIYFTSLLLSVPLFVTHASLVIALWLLDRSPFVKRWEFSLYAGVAQPLRQLDAATAARPGAIQPITDRGNFFAAYQQFELALTDYRAALKISPKHPTVLYDMGNVYQAQKRFTDAEKYFRAALQQPNLEPSFLGHAHFNLAFCLYMRGDVKHALPEFDQAIANVSDTPEFYLWRGMARRAAHDDANARADFERTVELAETTKPELAAHARGLLQQL
jgi:tetratricopeptide (TPR) repeat protein